MFAFALWDSKERVLFLARDRMGEKPLFYGWCGATFVFGSELKALRAFDDFDAPVDPGAIGAYLRFGYVPYPFTIYSGIRKLPPATFLRLGRNHPDPAPEPQAYWSIKNVIEAGINAPVDGSYPKMLHDLERILGDVIESQMLSDVPLGSFLSGGV